MEWITAVVAVAIGRALAEVDGGSNGGALVLDLMNMQWWQGLLAIIAALGLSPAPWILGLATNKIQFTSTADANYALRSQEMRENYDALVAVKDLRYADLEASVVKIEKAAATDKQTAATVSEALAESTDLGKMAIHVIAELRQAAQEVNPHGE